MMVFIYRKQSGLSQTKKKIAHPGIVGVLQTAGNNLKFNPHCHLICTDGVMIENKNDDTYIPIPFLPYDYIRIS